MGVDGSVIEVCHDPLLHEVHALRGKFFSSMQFHAESLLTQNGLHIIAESIKRVIPSGAAIGDIDYERHYEAIE